MSNEYISRRSFTHRLTKAVFALAGAGLAVHLEHLSASNPPRGTPPNRMGEQCGNAGVECRTGCAALGVKAPIPWNKCCYNPSGAGAWMCCKYYDFCSNSDSPEKIACRTRSVVGATPFSATQEQWCGNKVDVYVCTQSVCSGSFADYSTCATNCGGFTFKGQKL